MADALRLEPPVVETLDGDLYLRRAARPQRLAQQQLQVFGRQVADHAVVGRDDGVGQSRLVCCSSRILSSTVSRQIRR